MTYNKHYFQKIFNYLSILCNSMALRGQPCRNKLWKHMVTEWSPGGPIFFGPLKLLGIVKGSNKLCISYRSNGSWSTKLHLNCSLQSSNDIYFRFIPESIRWLHLRGKEDEAKEQLAKVAAINGREMPNEVLKKIEGSGEAGNFKHLFFNWKVAKITLMSWNLWWVTIVDINKPRP